MFWVLKESPCSILQLKVKILKIGWYSMKLEQYLKRLHYFWDTRYLVSGLTACLFLFLFLLPLARRGKENLELTLPRHTSPLLCTPFLPLQNLQGPTGKFQCRRSREGVSIFWEDASHGLEQGMLLVKIMLPIVKRCFLGALLDNVSGRKNGTATVVLNSLFHVIYSPL